MMHHMSPTALSYVYVLTNEDDDTLFPLYTSDLLLFTSISSYQMPNQQPHLLGMDILISYSHLHILSHAYLFNLFYIY